MWKSIALAVAVLAPATAPQLLHEAQPAPSLPFASSRASSRASSQAAAPAAGKTFAATCRGDQLLDSRPDPAWVGESFAGDDCRSPVFPAAIDGVRASRAQVVAAMAGAKRYQAAANDFERCVSDFVAARHQSRPLTQVQLIIENHRVLVSQRAKERAQAQVNVAVNAFNEYGSDCPDHG